MVDLAIFFPSRLSIDVIVRYREILSNFWQIWIGPMDRESKPLMRNDNSDVVQDPLYSGLELDRYSIDDGVVVLYTLTQHHISVHPFPCGPGTVHTLVVERWPSGSKPFRGITTYAQNGTCFQRPDVRPSPVIIYDRSLESVPMGPVVKVGLVPAKPVRSIVFKASIT